MGRKKHSKTGQRGAAANKKGNVGSGVQSWVTEKIMEKFLVFDRKMKKRRERGGHAQTVFDITLGRE